jgi:excisionase family DNA binding protein
VDLDLDETPERLAAYRALALEHPRRFAELLEKAQADAGIAPGEEPADEALRADDEPSRPEGMLTVAEFAEMSRLSRPTIYRGIDHGDINAIRIGGTIRIPEGDAVRLFGSPERMLTVAELAEASRLSRPTIYRQIDHGNIDAVKICGTIRIPQSVATAFLRTPYQPEPAPTPASAPGAEQRQTPQAPPSGQESRPDPPFPAVRFQPSPFAWSEDDDHV